MKFHYPKLRNNPLNVLLLPKDQAFIFYVALHEFCLFIPPGV